MDPRLPAYPQTHCVLLLLLLLVILNAISYYGSGFKDPVFYKKNQGVKPSSTAIILRARARDGAANEREFARSVRTPHRTIENGGRGGRFPTSAEDPLLLTFT